MQAFYAILATILVSSISLIGIFFLFIKESSLDKLLKYFVAFSAGAFLGEVIFHILPESTETFGEFSTSLGILMLIGFFIFFLTEKIIHWRHCHHTTEKEHYHPVGTMSLIGDSVHNILDGVIIGSSFMANTSLGIITTIAVILHEIPQEIGDFGLLLHSGYTKKKALLLNFTVGLSAILGTLLSIILHSNFENITKYILPITAGGFLYMATVDLIPELKEEAKFKNIAFQFLIMILGIVIMYLLLFLE